MIGFIARMNPLALRDRTERQEQLTKDTTAHAHDVVARRLELLEAEKTIRTRPML